MKKFITSGLMTVAVLSSIATSTGVATAGTNFADSKISAKATEWQNTDPYNNPSGAIDLTQYNQAKLNILAPIAGGDDKYKGNSFLKNAATEHIYALGNTPYSNFIGKDGVLKLYNQSKFMSNQQVQDAIDWWNTLARKEIVKLVTNKADSDETIHDVIEEPNGILGGQTYDGNGIEFYPNSWSISNLPEEEQNLQKVATLIHEIGHGMGVTHLGGGNDGINASNDSHFGNEVMSLWSPIGNEDGITSTPEDAATIALAGLTYRKPTKSAEWIIHKDYYNNTVKYNRDKTITTDIPFGIEIYYDGNYMNTITPTSGTATIGENYNLYTVDNSAIKNQTINQATMVGTTLSNNMIGKEVKLTNHYTSNHNQSYYSFIYENKEYVLDHSAFSNINEK